MHFLYYIQGVTLHHDIDNLAWDDDDFLWSGAVQLFGGQLVSHDNLLNLLAWSILCHFNREAHLTIELNRVLLRRLYQVCFVARWPFGVANRTCFATEMPCLFCNVRSVWSEQDCESLEDSDLVALDRKSVV